MKRLMILLMVVLAVGVMAGIVNAEVFSQDFGVENFPADMNFRSGSVPITHTGTGPTDLGFEAAGYTTTNQPPGSFGVFNNWFEIKHFSSNSPSPWVKPEATDPIWGVEFGNVRTGYIRFDSVDLGPGSSLSMSIGEFAGSSNTGDDDVVIRVYVNGEPGLGKDIFDSRAGSAGTLDSSDAVGGATYVEDDIDGKGGTLTYHFAVSDISVILYVAILTDDAGEDGYYIDDIEIDNGMVALVAPIGEPRFDWNWTTIDLALLEWQRSDPNGPDVDPTPYPVNVYFGTDENMAGAALIEANQDIDETGNFLPKPLDPDTDYYWRVDGIDPNNGIPTIITGPIFHFVTTTPKFISLSKTDLEVSEEGPTSDTFILSLSKDPAPDSVDVTFTEVLTPIYPSVNRLEMESYNGENAAAPELQVTHSGGTVVTSKITQGQGDMEEDVANGTADRGSSDLEFFSDGSSHQIIGLRFTNVVIPRGATINSAVVEFEVDQSHNTAKVYGFITGEKVANASQFVIENFHMADRLAANPTTAVSTLEWTVPYAQNAKVLTQDIAPVIEEIVGQAGWASGQSIVIFFTEEMSYEPADVEHVGVASTTYTLDTSNWQGITVEVAAIDDDILETDPDIKTLITEAVSTGEWDNLPVADVTVTIAENECGAWNFAAYDFNTDCVINLKDLAIFAKEFGNCTDRHFPALCNDAR